MKGDMIGWVVGVAIVVGSTLIIVNTIMPTIKQGQDFQSFSDAKKTLEALDAAVSQVFFEAPGARRSIDVNLKDGKMIVSGASDRIKIRLDDMNMFTPGFRRQEGNVLVTSGSQVEAYEADVDSDGNKELVLENSAVLFAVKKIGSNDAPDREQDNGHEHLQSETRNHDKRLGRNCLWNRLHGTC
jgi:hypothetical protein